ncbi:MAG: ComF family protein [Acutalibacteraceae bacterium]
MYQIEGHLLCQNKSHPVYRSENVKNVYKVNTNFEMEGKKILLIDDVCTTGNTLRECSKTLLSSDVENVLCLVIAFAK